MSARHWITISYIFMLFLDGLYADTLTESQTNSIRLKMLSFSDPIGHDQLQKWSEGQETVGTDPFNEKKKDWFGNVKLNRYVNGFRSTLQKNVNGPSQRAVTGGTDWLEQVEVFPITSYPIKTQFLVVAKVPDGIANVKWDISNPSYGNVAIVKAPDGTQFLGSSSAITPVLLEKSSVQIENTHSTPKQENRLVLPTNWNSKLEPNVRTVATETSTVYPRFYKLGPILDWVEYQRNFTIRPHETYIVITATQLGVSDIVASFTGDNSSEETVYASVEWTEQPSIKPIQEYAFSVNIIDDDTSDPIDLVKHDSADVTLYVRVENKISSDPLPKNLLSFRIYPQVEDGWWGDSPEPRASTKYSFRWTDQLDDGPPDETHILPGSTRTVSLTKSVINRVIRQAVARKGEPPIIQKTELYFVGPISSNTMDAYVILTNETTTVTKVVLLSGLGSLYDGANVLLKNQSTGPVILTEIQGNPRHPTIERLSIGTGTNEAVLTGYNNISFSDTSGVVTVKFKVRDELGREASESVTLRR